MRLQSWQNAQEQGIAAARPWGDSKVSNNRHANSNDFTTPAAVIRQIGRCDGRSRLLYFVQMIHRLVLFLALLLPIQFAWSAASAYCEHERETSSQANHFGHHVHAHKGEPKSKTSPRLAADPDCASCHAASAPAIVSASASGAVVPAASLTARMILPAFSSAPSRAPDRPQWLRLV